MLGFCLFAFVVVFIIKMKFNLLFCMVMVDLDVVTESGFLLSVVLLVMFLVASASQVMRTL